MWGHLWAKSFGVMLAFTGVAMGECQRAALGQPVGDGTLNTQVNVSGSFFNITGGQQAGPNLFHSFQTFNIPAGKTAQFLPASTVEAIFGRITGSSPSQIGGQIRVSGDANLFLLNPSGFVFEAGSSLGLNGNFTLATADSVRFANGDRFFASLSEPSLLSISAPVGLGNISTNSGIENRGNLINNGGDITIAAELIAGAGDLRSVRSIQLTTQDSIELGSLIAQRISAASQGNASFRALSAPSSVSLSAGKDLRVVQGIKTLGTSGDAGSVVLKAGGDISIEGRIDSRSTAPVGDAGSVELTAGGNIQLTEIQAYVGPSTRGDSGDVTLESGGTLMVVNGSISTFNAVNGAGNGGDIRLGARDILLTGTRLQSSNLGEGNGGNIELQAQDRIQLRSSPTNLARVLSQSNLGSEGDSGNILLQAAQIELVDALLDTQMRGVGRGGDITLRATNPVPLGQDNQITLAGDRAKSELMSRLTGRGLAGNIRLESQALLLSDDARISSVTEGQGNAGSIAIQARTLLGLESNSLIETGNNRRTARGDGGALSIETAQLSLQTGARLQSAIEGQGDAGDILIKASEFINIDGENPSGPAAFLKASVATSGQGQAGRIAIKTGDLTLSNGAQVQSNGENSGAIPGQIEIAADTFLLANGARLSADVRNSARGDGGTVSITAENIRATGNSDISALTKGGDLGLISLKANAVEGLQPSDRLTLGNDLLGQVTIENLPDPPVIPVDLTEIPTGEPTVPESPNSGEPASPIEPAGPNREPPPPPLPPPPNETINNDLEFSLPATANPSPRPTHSLPKRPPLELNAEPESISNSKPGPSTSILFPREVLASAIAVVVPQSIRAKEDESNQNSQLQVDVLVREDKLATPQFLGCRNSDAMLRLSGRGGLADSAQQVLPGRSLWQDPRAAGGDDGETQWARQQNQPMYQEASYWRLTKDHQIQLQAVQELLPGHHNNCPQRKALFEPIRFQ